MLNNINFLEIHTTVIWKNKHRNLLSQEIGIVKELSYAH